MVNSPLASTDPSGNTTVTEYVVHGVKVGAISGGIIGMICGGLNAWSRGDDIIEGMLVGGGWGVVVGGAAGFFFAVGTALFPATTAALATPAAQVGATAAVLWVAGAKNGKELIARTMCIVAGVAVPQIVVRLMPFPALPPNAGNNAGGGGAAGGGGGANGGAGGAANGGAGGGANGGVAGNGGNNGIGGANNGIAANDGTLTPAERADIQGIADKFNTTIDVVGSRAAGQGRNIHTDFPVGPKIDGGPQTRSDIDFRIDDRHPQVEDLIKELNEVGNGAGRAGTQWNTNDRPSFPPVIRFFPRAR